MAKKTLVSKILSRLPKKTKEEKKDSPAAENPRPKMQSLRLVFFIVDWQRSNVVSDVCVAEKVRFHFTTKGQGTANSEILDLLGIGSSDKAVITCLEQAVGVEVLMKEVRKKLKPFGPGVGIAFTVPLSAINDPVLMIFKQSIYKNEKITAGDHSGKGASMSEKITNDLIVAIVNHGFSDELMNTARAAGAVGGTLIHARGQAHEGAVKFFGVSVQDEKEMILILTSREKKVPIMQAVCEAHGLNTSAQGIVFSMPVDNVMGLSMD